MAINRRSFIRFLGTSAIAASLPKSAYALDAESVPEISFVQLTDTHIPHESGIERTKLIIDNINNLSLPHDFIIHTGDISNGHGKAEDMVQAKSLLKFAKTTYFVPGNWDVTFDHPEKFAPVFEKHFGPCNQTISPASGLRMVLFNSQPLSDRANSTVRDNAFEQLEQMLNPSMPTILFCHATGLPDFYSNEMHTGWKAETMTRWADMMKHGGVFAVLAGHFHRDEYHLLNDIPLFISAPVVGWWGRQSTFRHWTLKNGTLTYRTIYV